MRLYKALKIKDMKIKRLSGRCKALKVRMNRVKVEAEQAIRDEENQQTWTGNLVDQMQDGISTDDSD